MTVDRAYLDYNASAPLLQAARDAMLSTMNGAANPSSVQAEGRAARRVIDEARRDVAALVGAEPEGVIFTSGATEAAATLLTPQWRLGRGALKMGRLIVCAADHPCLLSGGSFAFDRITCIGIDSNGLVRIGELEATLAGHDAADGPPLVAIHLANNETGVVQPVAEIAALVKAAGGILVLDAVQVPGRIPLDIKAIGADFLIVSAHKIGGPKGVGAFVAASTLMMPKPLIAGGGQERGHRGGTENLTGIAGFGAAALAGAQGLQSVDAIRGLRDRAEQLLLEMAPDAIIHGAKAPRLANTLFFSVPGVKAETAQIGLDLAGIAVSAGSACSSGKVGPSHVLKAMGAEYDMGALRISIGAATTAAEIDRFAAALAPIVARRTVRSVAA